MSKKMKLGIFLSVLWTALSIFTLATDSSAQNEFQTNPIGMLGFWGVPLAIIWGIGWILKD